MMDPDGAQALLVVDHQQPRNLEIRSRRALMRTATEQPLRRRNYARWLLLHPLNLMTTATFLLAGVVSGTLWLLPLIATLDVVFCGAASRLKPVRRGVDSAMAQSELEDRYRALQPITSLLGRPQRDEVRELSRLVAEVEVSGAATPCPRSDLLALPALYAQLALTQQQALQAGELGDRAHLTVQLRMLETGLDGPTPPEVQRHGVQAMSVLRKRLSALDDIDEMVQVLEHRMLVISQLVRLVHQRVFTPTVGLSCELIDELLFSLDEGDRALAELEADCARAEGASA